MINNLIQRLKRKPIVQEQPSEREIYLRKGMEEFDRYVCDGMSGQGFRVPIDIGKVVFVSEYELLLRRWSNHDKCYDIDESHPVIDPKLRLPIFGESVGSLSYHEHIEKKKTKWDKDAVLNYKPFDSINRTELTTHCYMLSLPRTEVWDRDLFYLGIYGAMAYRDGSITGAIELARFEPTFLLGSLRGRQRTTIKIAEDETSEEKLEEEQATKLLPPGWCPGWVYEHSRAPFAFLKTYQLIGDGRLLRDKRRTSYLEEECFGSAYIYNERGEGGEKKVYTSVRTVSSGARECIGISREEFRELIKPVEEGLSLFYKKEKWKDSEPR